MSEYRKIGVGELVREALGKISIDSQSATIEKVMIEGIIQKMYRGLRVYSPAFYFVAIPSPALEELQRFPGHPFERKIRLSCPEAHIPEMMKILKTAKASKCYYCAQGEYRLFFSAPSQDDDEGGCYSFLHVNRLFPVGDQGGKLSVCNLDLEGALSISEEEGQLSLIEDEK
ncbi:hypothetical protein HYS49_00485 [Candidatus Woesearchaeota archaeon]|nr:hypothetical protein [Candidatus Woesearchaeota archaeon]